MKKIANILSQTELSNHKKLEWINYDSTLANYDIKLPTLIIGWNNIKQIFPSHSSILSKRISSPYSNIRWEFSMVEKMTDHFNGIEAFIKTAPREYIDMYKYDNIDPIKNNIQSEEHLIEILESILPLSMAVLYRYKEEMIYICDNSKDKKPIVSIYLNAYKYFGFDINKIMNLIENQIFYKTIDSEGLLYQSYYKQFPEFDQLKRTMVLFLGK